MKGWCAKSVVRKNICIVVSPIRNFDSLSSLVDKVDNKKKQNQRWILKQNIRNIFSFTAFLWKVVYNFLWNVLHFSKHTLPPNSWLYLDIVGSKTQDWILNVGIFIQAIMVKKSKALHTSSKRTLGKVQLSSRPNSKKWAHGFLVPLHL